MTHNTLSSSQPAYLRSLLSYHIPARSLRSPTPICCRSLVSTQPLFPAVSALLSPQYGTHSLLAFTLVLHHILSIVFLKPTVSIRPSVIIIIIIIMWFKHVKVIHNRIVKNRKRLTQVTQVRPLCSFKDFIYLLTHFSAPELSWYPG